MAPPQGSAPLRHLSTCLRSAPTAWAKPVKVRPLASLSLSMRCPKSSGSTPLRKGTGLPSRARLGAHHEEHVDALGV